MDYKKILERYMRAVYLANDSYCIPFNDDVLTTDELKELLKLMGVINKDILNNGK